MTESTRIGKDLDRQEQRDSEYLPRQRAELTTWPAPLPRRSQAEIEAEFKTRKAFLAGELVSVEWLRVIDSFISGGAAALALQDMARREQAGELVECRRIVNMFVVGPLEPEAESRPRTVACSNCGRREVPEDNECGNCGVLRTKARGQ